MEDYKNLIDSPKGWLILAGIIFGLLMTNACHEGAHALAAWWSGDRRLSIRRRTTLNPISHFHWLLTLVLPVLSIMLLGWFLGGARPVMVDAGRIGPRRMAFVAVAGPLGNFLFAGFVLTFMGLAMATGWVDPINPIDTTAWRILQPAMWFSVFLGVLNLVPLPPLDGSRIVGMLMPDRVRRIWYMLAPLGLIGVLFLLLWASGALRKHGLAGRPDLFFWMKDRVEDCLFAMKDFWRDAL